MVMILICLISNMRSVKVLTGVICIDRDNDLAKSLYNSLIKNSSTSIIIVTRDSDIKTINFWKDKAIVKIIPHYDIVKRHNMENIIKKRNIILKYAKDNKYDAIWFVDSDIIPLDNTLNMLLKSDKDICVSPARLTWTDKACVGIKSDLSPYVKIHYINDDDKKYDRLECIIGGFGCTLIKRSTFDVKIECMRLEDDNIINEGEDTGFFINCYNAGKSCEYLTHFIQPHLFDRNTINK